MSVVCCKVVLRQARNMCIHWLIQALSWTGSHWIHSAKTERFFEKMFLMSHNSWISLFLWHNSIDQKLCGSKRRTQSQACRSVVAKLQTELSSVWTQKRISKLCCCFVECSVAVNKPKLKTAQNSEALDSRGRRRGRSCGDAMFSDIRSLKTDGQMWDYAARCNM